jgi:hypothetical protein
LHGALAVAFTSGLHAAFYALMGFMVLAAVLSALRAGSIRPAKLASIREPAGPGGPGGPVTMRAWPMPTPKTHFGNACAGRSLRPARQQLAPLVIPGTL